MGQASREDRDRRIDMHGIGAGRGVDEPWRNTIAGLFIGAGVAVGTFAAVAAVFVFAMWLLKKGA